MRANWAFVSGVSLVSDNLKLITTGCRDVDGRKRIICRFCLSTETGETGARLARVSRETTRHIKVRYLRQDSLASPHADHRTI
jgi:hypothetical protein